MWGRAIELGKWLYTQETPGSLLDMQNLISHPRPTESETEFFKIPSDSYAH